MKAKMETKAEYYLKVEETISKFKNGKERYRNSATFNRVIQMLVRDCDPLEIIDQLVTITEDTNKAFKHHLVTGPAPIIIKDEIIKPRL